MCAYRPEPSFTQLAQGCSVLARARGPGGQFARRPPQKNTPLYWGGSCICEDRDSRRFRPSYIKEPLATHRDRHHFGAAGFEAIASSSSDRYLPVPTKSLLRNECVPIVSDSDGWGGRPPRRA